MLELPSDFTYFHGVAGSAENIFLTNFSLYGFIILCLLVVVRSVDHTHFFKICKSQVILSNAIKITVLYLNVELSYIALYLYVFN